MPEGMTKKDIQDHIDNQLSMERDNNLKQIKREVEEKFEGNFITDGSRIFYLVGACATHEDYYYVCLDSKNNIRFVTCVEKIELINEIHPIGFEFLISIIRESSEIIVDYVKSIIDKSDIDVLFTPIIGEKFY